MSNELTIIEENVEVVISSAGSPGPQGPAGADGADGQGVPTGGSTGQILAKTSNTDYDTQWINNTDTFLELTDTPSSYATHALKVVRVNAGETGLEFVAGGGGGEVNTASNVGVGGVGVFKQKTGVDLEFRSINAGSNKVTVTLDSGNNEIDINVNESNFSLTSSNLSDFTEAAQDAVGAALSSSGEGVDLVYNDAGNSIRADLDLPNLGSTSSTEGLDLMLLYDNSASEHRVITVDDFIAGKGITDEFVKVSVTDTTPGYLSTKIKAGSGITLDIDNPGSDEDFLIDLDFGIVFDKTSDNTDSVSEGVSNLYFTNERAQDAVGTILTDTSSIDFTYNDAGNQITAAVLPGGVDHNSLLNYSANRHIDHTSVSISAGTGLSGGGDISANRTINLANTSVSAGSYGSANQVGTFTVDAQGRLTAASNTSIQPASDTQSGLIEIATISETNTGTDATRAVSPDGLAGSYAGSKNIGLYVVEAGTALTTGDGKAYMRIPVELNGMNLVSCSAAITTTSSSGNPTFMIARGRQTSPTSAHSYVDMLSTAITIDATEYDSKDATTAAVINTSNDDVLTGDLIRIDVDSVGTGSAGLIVTLTFRLP